MTKIRLSGGKWATIDDEDYGTVIKFSPWFCSSRGYAVCNINGQTGHMHRLILQSKFGEFTDHINGNPLDNRKSNLRVCNHSQNGANQVAKKKNKTGFKGVHWSKTRKKFCAQIQVNQKMFNLGRYSSATDAAIAYNKAATKAWGKFARLNQLP